MIRVIDDLVLRANFLLELRERGKLKHRVEKHNIMVNLGRHWLFECIGETDYGTYPVTHPVRFIKFLGFGIGSYKQSFDVDADYPALASYYPGTAVQTDVDPTVETLERPVAIRDVGGNIWAEELAYSPGSSPPYVYGDFVAHFSETDFCVVDGAAFAQVPLSEAALMLSDQDPTADPYAAGGAARQRIAFYVAFSTISKTNEMTMDVRWRIRA